MKHDRECIGCKYFFECEGKPEETEQCIKYKDRKKDEINKKSN